jgi:hypothetical protein
MFKLSEKLIEKKNLLNQIKIMPKIYLIEKSLPMWDISKDLKIKLLDDNLLVSGNVIKINYWYQLKMQEFGYLFYQAEKIIVPTRDFLSLFSEDLWDKIIFYQNEPNLLPEVASQIYLSDNIKHVDKQIKKKFNLIEYHNLFEPAIFFGVYNSFDLEQIRNHQGKKYVMFGGSDLDKDMFHTKILIPILKKENIDKYFIISENLYQRALELNFDDKKLEIIKLDLTENWNKIEKFGKKIYIYDGCGKNGKLYHREIADKIIELLKNRGYNFEVIYSSSLNLSYDRMLEIYQQCFIGIRLTKKDGNANTVLELGKLGIPVIFNGEGVNAIHYFDEDDIVNKILDYYHIIF